MVQLHLTQRKRVLLFTWILKLMPFLKIKSRIFKRFCLLSKLKAELFVKSFSIQVFEPAAWELKRELQHLQQPNIQVFWMSTILHIGLYTNKCKHSVIKDKTFRTKLYRISRLWPTKPPNSIMKTAAETALLPKTSTPPRQNRVATLSSSHLRDIEEQSSCSIWTPPELKVPLEEEVVYHCLLQLDQLRTLEVVLDRKINQELRPFFPGIYLRIRLVRISKVYRLQVLLRKENRCCYDCW